uniref:Centlein n=1 Tax=Phallusia mammillata TaxID=59560 RepID=A0A6F9D935_9ASCI|nr:centlein [Phallusia mammillata]
MDDLFKSKDAEISKLLTENRDLSDELRQCQADKEFVWSLWKRLQVSSPDLTQAISLVLQREKEKAETKDRKVLEILQSKDEQIKDLQETARCLKADYDKVLELKVAAEGERNKLAAVCQQSEKENNQLKENVAKSDVYKDVQLTQVKEALNDAEKQKSQLHEQVTSLLRELQQTKDKKQGFDSEHAKLLETIHNYENEMKDRDRVLSRLTEEKLQLSNEIEEFKAEREKLKQVKESRKKQESKVKELKESYEQLKNHCHQQKQLILQLQELHNSTQKVLKEQQEAHKNGTYSLQSMYDDITRDYANLKEAHAKLQTEYTDLKQRVQVQENVIQSTEKELKKSIEMVSRRDRKYDYDDLQDHITSQQQEIDQLRKRLRDNAHRRSNSPYEAEQTFSPIIERGVQHNVPRSRSYSPHRHTKELTTMQKRLKATETRLEETKRLLEFKRDEVREIQQAHNRRLERLRNLQSDYKSLKSGSAQDLSPRKKRNRPVKSDRRDLRQENSDTVWNDLAYYKRENKMLAQERMSLEEELDNLRVQVTMDRATIQDLNMCLRNEKQELAAKLRSSARAEERRSSTPKKTKSPSPKPTHRAVKNLERRLENAGEDNRLLKKDRDRLLEDNRSLKGEIKSLKRDLTEVRHSGTTMRQENSELRIKLQSLDGDRGQMEREVSALRAENQGLRTENAGVRSENTSLRSENSDLRSDVTDLKRELSNLQGELRHIDRSVSSAEKRNGKPSSTHQRTKSDTAKQHQKFLNKSISEMRAAFGEDFNMEDLDPVSTTTMSEDTTAVDEEEIGRSDASSLGQSIVRASRRNKGQLRDEDADEDDTLVDEPLQTGGRKTGKVSSKRVTSRHGQGMLPTLRHRLASLQTQCQSLRTAKQNALKKMNDEKERNEDLQTEITSCQNKLKAAKQQIQRMSREAEILQRERDETLRDLEEAKSAHPEPQKHSDADYKYMESKLKLANSDVTRLNEQIKDLKKEIETKNAQISTDKEKVNRLERDVGAKRQLIDELRVKVRENDQKTKDDRQGAIELSERLRAMEEDLQHKKSHVESLRRQLQAAAKEKARYETMYNKSREELDKRCGEMSALQAGKLEAESATSLVEQAAEQQLQTLASRSEQALDKLKAKLERCEEKLNEFNLFVKSLTNNLIDLVQRQRDNFHREKSSHVEPSDVDSRPSSLSRAQTVACNILNISRSDFEDLMAPVDSVRRRQADSDAARDEERNLSAKSDQTWRSKVDKIATENPPFAKSLCRLLWDKVQDAVKLTEDKWRFQTEQLEQKLMSKT